MHKFCLSLVCPPKVQEKLLDVLLESDDTEVFTSCHVHSHGAAHKGLSAQEQVMGRSPAMLIQVLLQEAPLELLIKRVGKDFAGTGIRYWASPVAMEGVSI